MESFFMLGWLLITVISISQASSLNRSTDDDGECLEPAENVFYEDDRYDRSCERLGAALVQYVHLGRQQPDDPVPGAYQRFRQQIMAMIGVDIEDDEQILRFACRLGDIRTLDDFIETMNMASFGDQFKLSYRHLQMQLATIDGFHGVAKVLQILLAAQNSLRELTGRGENERLDSQEIARLINEENLAGILRHLEEVFGPGYLVYYLMRPYNDALIGVDHHLLAQALMDRDVACRLGMSPSIQYEFNSMESMLINGHLTRDLVHAYYELYVAADKMGFFNLS